MSDGYNYLILFAKNYILNIPLNVDWTKLSVFK